MDDNVMMVWAVGSNYHEGEKLIWLCKSKATAEYLRDWEEAMLMDCIRSLKILYGDSIQDPAVATFHVYEEELILV